jgi:hypothetical protein
VHERLVALACNINPNIEIQEGQSATAWINVGEAVSLGDRIGINVGSDGWTALVCTQDAQRIGSSENPFGPGAAACLGAANAFRLLFGTGAGSLDRQLRLSTWQLRSCVAPQRLPDAMADLTLVGAGAVGNGAAWALSRLPGTATLCIVDPERVELGNLQRYVLCLREDVDRLKTDVIKTPFAGPVRVEARSQSWEDFVEQIGVVPELVLVAVDSAEVRRAVQASLPRWIANAWTQPGDLGVSVHEFLGEGACLRCLYLPAGQIPSRDVVLAEGLRVPDQLMRIRELLYHGEGAPSDLLALVAVRFGLSADALHGFEGVALSKVFAEAVCGGAVLPLGAAGAPTQDVHVPLAHQSALAGILLAAAGVAHAAGWTDDGSYATRLNVMAPIYPTHITQPLKKDARGICICQDQDYQDCYAMKYRLSTAGTGSSS